MENLQLIVQAVKGKVTVQKFKGKDYLVAPVIPIVEGVLNGAKVEANEIGKFVNSWNGIPLPINHPMKNGQYVSANQQDILENNVIGQFFGAVMDGKKLKGNLWIDIEQAKAIGGEALQVLEKLKKGQPLEVSTAYFCDEMKESGVLNGKKYSIKHMNLRPDHLALLPNGTGACSWKDGAGAPRVACKLEEDEYIDADENETINEINVKINVGDEKEKDMGFMDRMREMLSNFINNAGMSFDQTRTILSKALRDNNANSSIYIRDVWDDKVVYEEESRIPVTKIGMPITYNYKMTLYQQGYSLGKDGTITFSDDKTEVRPETKYVPVKTNNEQSEQKEVEDVDKKQIIDRLIGNKERFTDDDRSWLDKLEVNQLEKLIIKDEPKTNEKTNEQQKPEVKPEASEQPKVNAKPKTIEEYIAEMPKDAKEFFTNSLKKAKEHRENLLKELVANERCAFSKEELDGFSTEMLEKLDSSLEVNDYSGIGGPKANSNGGDDDEDIPSPPPVVMVKKEEGGKK